LGIRRDAAFPHSPAERHRVWQRMAAVAAGLPAGEVAVEVQEHGARNMALGIGLGAVVDVLEIVAAIENAPTGLA